jgi:4-amino-4-deoxychorismate lyase
MLTLVNGRESDVLPVTDRGLQYGDGLFETIAVMHGRPRHWMRHLHRLVEGCRRLELPVPDADQLQAELQRVSGDHPQRVVKILITRGTGLRGYRHPHSTSATRIVQAHPWPAWPEAAWKQGVAVRWCQTRLARQPRLAGLKHLNRLEQILARAEWQDDYAEGLMCDSEGLVIEGTMSNLFLVTEGTLATPDLSQSGVAGVMRAVILDLAERLDMRCQIRPVTTAMVEAADALFLTNSLIGLWPVARLEAKTYEVAGKITQTLQTALHTSGDVA